jgi:hypothetical protein
MRSVCYGDENKGHERRSSDLSSGLTSRSLSLNRAESASTAWLEATMFTKMLTGTAGAM